MRSGAAGPPRGSPQGVGLKMCQEFSKSSSSSLALCRETRAAQHGAAITKREHIMNTAHSHKKMTASALIAAVSGITISLAAVILASPANAAYTSNGGFLPPDPCITATSCGNVHGPIALNPQPLPPGLRHNLT